MIKCPHQTAQLPASRPTRLAVLRPTGKPFDIADPAVAGLLVRVGPAGHESLLFRYQWNGERTRIALGELPEIGSSWRESSPSPTAASSSEESTRAPALGQLKQLILGDLGRQALRALLTR